ncbi:MAG: hypothetical protein OEW64_13755 [Gammaproteobacteria bacterium]|nr:hypothetical protein [Gammaproteobacteria bacterium]MDH5305146.1 hypothetical protein [Gammaproteobacteria bacterium]
MHGSGFKPPADKLQDMVAAALRAGIERDYPEQLHSYDEMAVRLAYYGDLNNALLGEPGRAYDEQIDLADRLNALQNLRSLDARKRFGIRQYDCLPGKTAVPEFLASIITPLCGVLRMTGLLLRRIVPDFAEYIDGNSDYAEKVRERVRNALCALLDRGDRVMLVSHGTGCVVSYDILWQLSHEPRFAAKYADAKVDNWVTLGAPLGDRSIRRYLLGNKGEPVTFPKNVIAWHNVAAEDDYICCDNTLADDFRHMLQQRVVSAVQDYRIYNLAVRYGRSNPHSSVGYFIHPRMSKIIVDWVQSPVLETDPTYIL